MATKRPRSPAKKQRSSGAARGRGSLGKAFDPTKITEEPAPAGVTRDAPAPGVPMPDADYDELKTRARTTRLPPSQHEQEDPSGKKQK